MNESTELIHRKQASLKIPVLMYHSVYPSPQDFNAVSTASFEEQMLWLAEYRIPLTLEATLDSLRTGSASDHAVLVTFDDAYSDIVEYALPSMLKHKIPGTFFPIVETLGGDDLWNHRAFVTRTHLAPEQVRDLASIPGNAIGAHGFTHHRLTRLPDYRVVAEMVGAKAALEELCACQVKAYAYPYGGYDSRITALASRYFQVGFASDREGVWDWLSDPFAVRRLYVPPSLSLDGFMRLLNKPYGTTTSQN